MDLVAHRPCIQCTSAYSYIAYLRLKILLGDMLKGLKVRLGPHIVYIKQLF